MSKTIELIVLVVLIAVTYYFYKKSKAQADSQKAQYEPIEQVSKYILTVKIEGMMCEKCAARVTEGLSAFGNVTVNLDEKTASIESDELADAVAVEEKINELGYKFEGILNDD